MKVVMRAVRIGAKFVNGPTQHRLGWEYVQFRFIAVLCATFAVTALYWLATSLAEIGQIKTLQGKVQILRAGKSIAAKLGDELKQSDTVKTGADSRVGIVFVDQTLFSAGPKSTVELTRFRFNRVKRDQNSIRLNLKRGTMSVISGRIAKSYPDAMTVRTPVAIMGVRGTRFLARAGG